MYDIDYKNTRKGYSFGIIFFLAGLLFFSIIFWLTFSGMIKKAKLDSVTTATKIDENCHNDEDDGGILCSPVYYYRVDNKEYSCRISYSTSKRVVAKQNKVYYDSANPDNCVTDYTVKPHFFMYVIIFLPILFMVVGSGIMLKVRKNIKKMQNLALNGQLIKNLQYTMEPTNISINEREIYAIAVDYTLPSGSIIHLVGDPRYDAKQADTDGLVDLLIDPSDPNIYYIDFNIQRK